MAQIRYVFCTGRTETDAWQDDLGCDCIDVVDSSGTRGARQWPCDRGDGCHSGYVQGSEIFLIVTSALCTARLPPKEKINST